MNNTYRQYLDLIRETRRCQTEVLQAVRKMTDIDPDMAAELGRELIENGEDSALGILANVCALREIRLTPDLLPAVLEVIEPITDFGRLLRFQDREAIPFLLDAAASEAVSSQRQAYAALLAAEMAVFHGADLRPVRRTLRLLEQEYYVGPEVEALLASAAALIDLSTEERDGQNFLFQANALDLLPENPPPVVIGDGGTVRRPIPKIGRNAPCPCGSGKKYKKCCMEKDQLQIRDASAYEGLTKTQVLASPDLVNDVAMIREMRSYALKKLDPARLNVAQLFAAGERCELFGLRELAFQMLLEIEKREDRPLPPTAGYLDLMRAVLDAGDLDLAEQIGKHIPWQDKPPGSDVLRIHCEILRHGDLLKRLEERFRREFTAAEESFGDLLLLRLSYGLEKMYPALSLIFARAYISGCPDRFFDIDTLLTTVRRARAALDLEPWDDPIEDYIEWYIKRDMEETRQKDQSEELRALGDKLDTAREEVRQRQQELRQKEGQLRAMAEKLEMRPPVPQPEVERTPQISNAEDTQTIGRLRSRIDALKAEIGTQQRIRRDLRRELHEERKKSLQHAPAPSGPEQERLMDTGLVPPATIKKILIPEFMPAFHQACAAIPTVYAAKALKAVAGFSAGDEIVWRHTKPIKRISGCFRIRIGKDYRLLLNWKPDETLQVLDCIHRSNLEAWIRGRITA